MPTSTYSHAAALLSLLDAQPLPSFVADREGHYRYVNRAWQKLFRLEDSYALGHAWLDRVVPEELATVLTAWLDALKHGIHFECRCRINISESKSRSILIRAWYVPESDLYSGIVEAGEVSFLTEPVSYLALAKTTPDTAIIIGNKVHQQHERSLNHLTERSARNLKAVIEALPVATGIYTPEGDVLYLNPAFSELFGYTQDDIPTLEKWWEQAYPDPVYREWVIESRQVRQDDHIVYPILERRIRCKNGDVKIAIVKRAPLALERGHAFLVTMLDVTHQFIQQQALVEREQSYRQLFDHAELSIWNQDMRPLFLHLQQLKMQGITDLEQYLDQNPGMMFSLMSLIKVIDVNPATVRLFGGSQREDFLLHGFNYLFGRGCITKIREELLAFWRGDKIFRAEVELKTLQGKRIYAIISFPIPQDVETAKVVPVSLQDISDLALLEADLKAVSQIQSTFISSSTQDTFQTILQQVLQLTESEYGFVGEVLYDTQQKPYVRIHALSDISWDEASRAIYQTSRNGGMEFHQLDALFSVSLLSKSVTISNDPANDPRSKGLPPGHRPLHSFMSVPVIRGEEMIGLIGVANREGGYDLSLANTLQPVLVTYGQVINAIRTREAYQNTREALQQAEERWKFAIEGAGHGVWDWDLLSNVVTYSETWCRLLGYQKSELYESANESIVRVHPDDRQRAYVEVQRHLRGETDICVVEYRLRCQDGSYKWIAGRGMIISRDAQGRPLRMIGTHTDISRSKATEQALLANQMRLSSMIETAMDAIITVDSAFNIIVFNPAAEDMFGYRAEDMLGYPLDRLIPITKAPNHQFLMQQFAAEGGSPRRMHGRPGRQVMGFRSDGSTFPIEVSVSYSDNYGQPIYTAMVRDITERRAAEEEMKRFAIQLEQRVIERTRQLEEAREQAESANRAKSAFLANMSHEIRTPLNSVLGMAHLALQTPLEPKQRDYLQKITLSGTHLLGLINDILDFSKIEAGKLEIEQQPFDLYVLLENLSSFVSQKAAEKQLLLKIEQQACLPRYLRGDALRLQQVLLNLMSNAIKFTEQGSVCLAVSIAEDFEQQVRLLFEVKDTGIGMPESTLLSLFQSFHQADSSISRRYGGTGLGLAISHQLVQLMGGELQVHSEFGHGSTFSFSLVFTTVSDALYCTESNRHLEQHEAYTPVLHGKKVLLADDHPFNQQVAAEILEQVGIEVVIADHGKHAVMLTSQHTFDLILMDMQMPEMDGISATEHLRQNRALDHVPILAMTANVSVEDRQQCYKAGMNDFIGKPIQPDLLYRTLVYWFTHPITTPPQPAMVATTATQSSCPSPEKQWIDHEILHTMLGDNSERHKKYIAKFTLAMNDGLVELTAACAAQDLMQMAKICHRLKSIANTVGAVVLGQTLQEMETAALANRHEAYSQLALIEAHFQHSQHALNNRV